MQVLFALKRIWYFLYDNWKFTLPVFLIIVLLIVGYKACGKKKTSIDLERIEKINSANRAEREKELQRVIEDNAEVVRTNDNRTAIAETNVIERNRIIDEKVKAVDAEIQKAKQQGHDVTKEELECLLVPENCS